MPDPFGPATVKQYKELARLANKWGKPAARPGLTYSEAGDAIRAMRDYRAMESKSLPRPDPKMVPGETLKGWQPYRRPGKRNHGSRLG